MTSSASKSLVVGVLLPLPMDGGKSGHLFLCSCQFPVTKKHYSRMYIVRCVDNSAIYTYYLFCSSTSPVR